MIPESPKPTKDKLTEMVETNLKVSEEILETTKKIKKYINWLRILNIFKVFIIIVPIVFGLYYLSPYFKNLQSAFGVYGELLGIESPLKGLKKEIATSSPQDLMEQLNELKDSGQLEQFLK